LSSFISRKQNISDLGGLTLVIMKICLSLPLQSIIFGEYQTKNSSARPKVFLKNNPESLIYLASKNIAVKY